MTTWPVHPVVAPGAPAAWETGAARVAAEGSTAACRSPLDYVVAEGACRPPLRVWRPRCWARPIGPALWSVASRPQPVVLDSHSRRIIRFQKFLDQPERWCSSTVSRKDSGKYHFEHIIVCDSDCARELVDCIVSTYIEDNETPADPFWEKTIEWLLNS